MKKYAYLKVKIKELEITYVQLAKELNITPFTLSNKLNGKADFKLSELEKILEVINEKDEREICRILNIDMKKFA